ncbi:hypothetical protein GTW20_21140 [Nocardiopsis alba]|uniref:Uncharacterized protein n=1 Tax=Nocardiopsis alba TaxID=53437 RepID=A0A7K2IY28_9ACTN|nr:hypothetical protein [Nocardiopsis alba]MYR34685.1 hypothetical protein [Nocardiopsis alba]
MSVQEGSMVNNSAVFNNPVEFLKMVQLGHLHGNLFVYQFDTEGVEPQKKSWQYQKYLADTFHPASGEAYKRFHGVFKNSRWGILVGEPGSGRETAAIALHTSCGLQVHQVQFGQDNDNPDETPHRRLSRTKPIPGAGYIVDLSTLNSVDAQVVNAIRALWQKLEGIDSALIVITRPGTYDTAFSEAPVFQVDRPLAIDVLAKHLAHFPEAKGVEMLPRWPEVRTLMAGASPADAVRMANIGFRTFTARDRRQRHDTWVHEAIGIYSDWKAELDRWFDEHRGGSEAAWNRIVLISVAALEGLGSKEILRAADTLAPMLGVEKGDAGGLTGLGVEPTLRLVGARRGEGDRVRFSKPEYAAAVLDYVWSELPRIHSELLSWTDAIAAEHSKECLTSVRDAWIGLALRRNDPGLTIQLLDEWMKGRAPRKAVAGLAAEVASWPAFGSRMRRRLYEWARNPKTDEHAAVVATACVAYSRDDVVSALFRIKWLAQTESEKAREAALGALLEIAEDPELFFDVVRAVVDEWSHSGVRAERREIAHRFITGRLARAESEVPELLLRVESASDELRARTMSHVADLWRSLLGQEDDDALQEAIGPWMTCVLESEARFELVMRIFVAAVAGTGQELRGTEASGRTVVLGRTIIEWCDHNGIDRGARPVYGILTRLFTAHEPFGEGEVRRSYSVSDAAVSSSD